MEYVDLNKIIDYIPSQDSEWVGEVNLCPNCGDTLLACEDGIERCFGCGYPNKMPNEINLKGAYDYQIDGCTFTLLYEDLASLSSSKITNQNVFPAFKKFTEENPKGLVVFKFKYLNKGFSFSLGRKNIKINL